jgi:hypothetical protein
LQFPSALYSFTGGRFFESLLINEHGAADGMGIDRGNRSSRRKPMPLCPPQIPHNLTYVQILTAAVEFEARYFKLSYLD